MCVGCLNLSAASPSRCDTTTMKASHLHPVKHGASWRTKTQCQALDRTQPSLPMKRGRAGTMTHDYKRNGTIDLFAR